MKKLRNWQNAVFCMVVLCTTFGCEDGGKEEGDVGDPSGIVGDETNASSDADTDSDTGDGSDGDADTGSSSDGDADGDADTGSSSDGDADGDADTGSSSDGDADGDADTGSSSDGDADGDADTGVAEVDTDTFPDATERAMCVCAKDAGEVVQTDCAWTVDDDDPALIMNLTGRPDSCEKGALWMSDLTIGVTHEFKAFCGAGNGNEEFTTDGTVQDVDITVDATTINNSLCLTGASGNPISPDPENTVTIDTGNEWKGLWHLGERLGEDVCKPLSSAKRASAVITLNSNCDGRVKVYDGGSDGSEVVGYAVPHTNLLLQGILPLDGFNPCQATVKAGGQEMTFLFNTGSMPTP